MDHNYDVSDWVNIVENDIDYDKNIKLLVNSSFVKSDMFCWDTDHVEKKSNSIETNKLPDIAEIKMNNRDTLSDIIMLEKTSSYAKKIKHVLNKKVEDHGDSFIIWFTESLQLLRDIMFELSNRNSQSIHQDKKQQDKKVIISRNSYKFCEYGYGCKFNYEKKQKCHAHHFVFNLVYLDIIDILEYLSMDIFNLVGGHELIQKHDNMEEIRTSINTITYVLNHMHDELLQLKTLRPENYQNYVNRKYDLNNIPSKRALKKK